MLTSAQFDNYHQLVAYVNENDIEKSDIQHIQKEKNVYILFYWTDDHNEPFI